MGENRGLCPRVVVSFASTQAARKLGVEHFQGFQVLENRVTSLTYFLGLLRPVSTYVPNIQGLRASCVKLLH